MLCAASLGAQALPAAQSRAFDRGDRESRDLIAQIRCARLSAQARQDKRFASLDSTPDATECTAVAGHFVVAFIGGDTLFRHPKRFAEYDMTTGTRISGPVDTGTMLAIARADWAGVRRGMAAFEAADRQFIPLAFRFEADTIEVWLVPATVLMGSPYALGGEHGYVYAPNGNTLIREIDHASDYRAVTIPDTGMVTLTSKQPGVPTLSEFYLANQLNALGRKVAIAMPGLTSVLSGNGASAVWVQMVHH
jgi:hypothetical protein